MNWTIITGIAFGFLAFLYGHVTGIRTGRQRERDEVDKQIYDNACQALDNGQLYIPLPPKQ